MPSATEYAVRLREDAQRLLESRLTSLQKAIEDIKHQVAASSAQLEEHLGSLQHLELREVESILAEAMNEASSAATRESQEQKEHVLGFLAHFAHDLRQKETQDEILNLLLDAAGGFAPRVALFAAREDSFFGWSSRGFSEPKAAEISRWSCAKSESPFLRESLFADVPKSTCQRSADPKLAQLLDNESGTPWHAFPMRAIRRPVAVLLATPAEGRACDLETLCILLDLTGLSIENLALKILQEMSQIEPPRASVAPAPAAEAGEPAKKVPVEPEAAPTCEAMPSPPAPVTEPTEEAAPEPEVEAQPQPEVRETVEAAAVTEAVEAEEPSKMEAPEQDGLQPPVEEAPAPVVAVSAPPELVETPQPVEAVPPAEPAPAVALAPQGEAETPKAAKLREVLPLNEEEKLHSDARRFARLLISEIKLYNEKQVAEGRARKDLYDRLRRDVERSRDMYEKRVSPAVSRKTDYFHEEIVKILAANDPSALGSDYPGPRVAE
jgi:hypothetical protein